MHKQVRKSFSASAVMGPPSLRPYHPFTALQAPQCSRRKCWKCRKVANKIKTEKRQKEQQKNHKKTTKGNKKWQWKQKTTKKKRQKITKVQKDDSFSTITTENAETRDQKRSETRERQSRGHKKSREQIPTRKPRRRRSFRRNHFNKNVVATAYQRRTTVFLGYPPLAPSPPFYAYQKWLFFTYIDFSTRTHHLSFSFLFWPKGYFLEFQTKCDRFPEWFFRVNFKWFYTLTNGSYLLSFWNPPTKWSFSNSLYFSPHKPHLSFCFSFRQKGHCLEIQTKCYRFPEGFVSAKC